MTSLFSIAKRYFNVKIKEKCQLIFEFAGKSEFLLSYEIISIHYKTLKNTKSRHVFLNVIGLHYYTDLQVPTFSKYL